MGATIAEVDALCDRGLYLTAHRLAVEASFACGSLRERRVCARIATHLGAAAFAERLELDLMRRAPRNLEVRASYATWLLARRGPFDTFRWLGRVPPTTNDGPDAVAAYHALRAICATHMRDFDTAEAELARAPAAAEVRGRVTLARAAIFERSDRPERALELLRTAQDDPSIARAVNGALAHLLVMLDRDEEALEVLARADAAMESSHIALELATLQSHLRRYDDERRTLLRVRELLPLAEPALVDVLVAREADNAFHRGDVDGAVRLLEGTRSPFHAKVRENLLAKREARSLLLDVRLVRQHHMTCAPATLTSLARFFGAKVDHLQLAEEICYDGTPAHAERAWARRNGWTALEFTVTEAAARALLDRELPFTFTLTEAVTAHLVAVIGYDLRRGTLFFRDPGQPWFSEALVTELLDHHAPSGPRGMVLVPEARAGDIPHDLPDRELFDRLDDVNAALSRHDREGAGAAYDALVRAAPNHRLTHQARRALAAYDEDDVEMLAANEALLALDGRNVTAQLVRLQCIGSLAPRSEHLRALEEAVSREHADPIFGELLASALVEDAQCHGRARRLLDAAFRARPHRAQPLVVLARIDVATGDLESAVERMRFAACLEPMREDLAGFYFAIARTARRTEEALSFLRRRNAEYGTRAAGPTATLFGALDALDRTAEAFDVLARALDERPDDGELLVFAAHAHLRHGQIDAAAELVERARRATTKKSSLLAAEAALSARRGDWEDEKRALEALLSHGSSVVPAHQALAARLAAIEGRASAIAHLDAACERLPHNRALARLRAEWLRMHDAPRAEAAVRALLELHPDDAWAHRELALLLCDARRFDEAFEACRNARLRAPDDPSYHHVHGVICLRADRVEEARASLLRALELEPDRDSLLGELLRAHPTPEERVELLTRVAPSVAERSLNGAAILSWYEHARRFLDPTALSSLVERIATERPELWASWSIRVHHLLAAQRVDQAHETIEEALRRFAMVARVWNDAAVVREARGDLEGAQAALQRALDLEPAYLEAALAKTQLLELFGDRAAARETLERQVRLAPENVGARLLLARWLASIGEGDEAVRVVEQALRTAPSEESSWIALLELDADMALRELEEHVRDRSYDLDLRLTLARLQAACDRRDEAMSTLEEIRRRDPKNHEARDVLAVVLAEASRLDEAEAALRGDDQEVPRRLEGRAAWVAWKRGEHESAIERLKAVVRAGAENDWPLRRLVEWCGARGDHRGELDAATRWCALDPKSAAAHAALGDAHLSLSHVDDAIAAFEVAVRLDPTLAFAIDRLLELLLRKKRFDDAERLLERVRTPVLAQALLRAMRLAAARGDDGALLESFRVLAAHPATTTIDLERGRSLAIHAGVCDAAHEVLREVARGPEGCEAAGALWIRTNLARTLAAPKVRELPVGRGGRAARGAVAAAADAWIARRARLRVLFAALLHRRRFAKITEDWAQLGRALIDTGSLFVAAWWLRDTKRRSDVSAWMLFNEALANRKLHRRRRARDAIVRATEAPKDATTPRCWLHRAFEEACEGQASAAAASLAHVDERELGAFDRHVHAMTRSMIEVRAADGPDSVERAARALAQIPRVRLPFFSELAWLRARALRRVARDLRSPQALASAYEPWGWFFAIVTLACIYASRALSARNQPVALTVVAAVAIGVPLARWAWSES